MVAAASVFLSCSVASAVTIGQTSSGTLYSCGANDFFTQASLAPASPSYTIPAGGGVIDSWSTGTKGATAGAQITLLVLQPTSSTTYQVLAFDTETLPNPLPASNIATFPVAPGLSVPGGALLGLYGYTTGEGCFIDGGVGDVVGWGSASAPMGDITYTQTMTASNRLLNASADLVQSMDVGLTASATPESINAGSVGLLGFSISNGGPSAGTATLVDLVPPGLSVLAAFVGSGTCTVSGQEVTCATAPLAVGSSTPAGVVVSAPSPGTFTNTGTLTTSIADPNPANNTAAATLTVNPVPVAARSLCRVVTLRAVPLGEAKSVLRVLGCAIGKVSKHSSKTIPKGDVISTSPGPGVQPAGTVVNIRQSSGKPKHRRR